MKATVRWDQLGPEVEILTIRIPIRLQRRGGRKRIVAPDGSEIARPTKPQPDGTLVKALARAWRWQRMLDEGIYATVSEIGEAEKISKSYVSRILRLALLAPDIVDAILAGRTDQGMIPQQLERPLPASWEAARGLLEEGSVPRMGNLPCLPFDADGAPYNAERAGSSRPVKLCGT